MTMKMIHQHSVLMMRLIEHDQLSPASSTKERERERERGGGGRGEGGDAKSSRYTE
jgi:hypothetical protein